MTSRDDTLSRYGIITDPGTRKILEALDVQSIATLIASGRFSKDEALALVREIHDGLQAARAPKHAAGSER